MGIWRKRARKEIPIGRDEIIVDEVRNYIKNEYFVKGLKSLRGMEN